MVRARVRVRVGVVDTLRQVRCRRTRRILREIALAAHPAVQRHIVEMERTGAGSVVPTGRWVSATSSADRIQRAYEARR